MLFSFLTCREALKRLDDYLDRELSARDMVLVKRHLKICHHCARQFANEAAFVNEVRAKLSHIEAPPGLMEKISVRLETKGIEANVEEE